MVLKSVKSHWWKLLFVVNLIFFTLLFIFYLRFPFFSSSRTNLFDSSAVDFNVHYHQSLDLFYKKNYQESYTILKTINQNVLNEKEQHAYLLLYGLVISRLNIQNAKQLAVEKIKKAQSLKDIPLNHFIEGIVQENVKKNQKAILAYHRAVKYEPKNPNFIRGLANYYYRTENIEKAITWNNAIAFEKNIHQQNFIKNILLEYFNFKKNVLPLNNIEQLIEIKLPSLIEQNQDYLAIVQLLYSLYKIRNIINHYEQHSLTIDNYSFDLKHTSPDYKIVDDFSVIRKLLNQGWKVAKSEDIHYLDFSKKIWEVFLLLNHYKDTLNLRTSARQLEIQISSSLQTKLLSNKSSIRSMFYLLLGDLAIANNSFQKSLNYYVNDRIHLPHLINSQYYLKYHQSLAYFHLKKYSQALDNLYEINNFPITSTVINSPNLNSPSLLLYVSSLQEESFNKVAKVQPNSYQLNKYNNLRKNSKENHIVFPLFTRSIYNLYQTQTYQKIISLIQNQQLHYSPIAHDQKYFLQDQLALAQVNIGFYDKAIEHYQQLLILIGEEIKNLQKYKQPAFRRIVKLKMFIAQTMNNLAWTQIKKIESGNHDTVTTLTSYVLAEDLIKKSSRLVNNAMYFYNLYWLYNGMNQKSHSLKAITLANKYLSTISDNKLQIDILLTTAKLYAKEGMFIQAHKFLKQANTIDVNDPRIEYYLEKGFTKKLLQDKTFDNF